MLASLSWDGTTLSHLLSLPSLHPSGDPVRQPAGDRAAVCQAPGLCDHLWVPDRAQQACSLYYLSSLPAGVEGNPYLMSEDGRIEPSLKRALSVRGIVKNNGQTQISKRVRILVAPVINNIITCDSPTVIVGAIRKRLPHGSFIYFNSR